MSRLEGACIFGQSGGPTSVINASAAGVIQEALKQDCITAVYGAAHGIKGILEENFFDMSKEDPYELELLKTTPSSALGSVRYNSKTQTRMKRITRDFWKYSRNTISDTSSTMAETTQWTPATRSANTCRRLAMSAE